MYDNSQNTSQKDLLTNSSIQYFPNENEIKNMLEDKDITAQELFWIDDTIKLTSEQKIYLKEKLFKWKEQIISKWLRKKEMVEFYKKFNIEKEDMVFFISYFWWEKILWYINNELEENTKENKYEYSFISTKFLDFIKKKELMIEDVLNTIIILKNAVLTNISKEETIYSFEITRIFDEISTLISKNYNDITIKLLNEYNNAINNSNIISKTDIYWNITDVNETFCVLSWFTREELIWQPHNIVRHPDMPKATFKELWDTIQKKQIWKWILKNKKKDWWSYWVKATVVPIIDKNDKIVEYISIRTDITELKEAYKNLDEYSSALNETSMVLKLNKDWKITTVNDSFLRMSWYQESDLLWKFYINDLIVINSEELLISRVPNISKEDLKEIKYSILDWKTWKWVIENKWRAWNKFWTSTNIIPILWLNEEIVEFVIIQNDVTDLEIAQQKLKQSLDKQKELDSKKDQFLNIASHELRTPMTSIKWYISMILDWDAWDINEEVRTYLQQVYKSSQRLLDLINDMLDVSKIESWNQKFMIEKIDIRNIIQETTSEIKTLFEKKKQKFLLTIDFDSLEYETDWNKLKQVILNLLWNANKFTPEWWLVYLHAYTEWNKLVISVRDSWIWIEKAHFWKIFEKFWQVKNPLTRDINWTWLWLPIAKAIIEQMKWFIDVESEIWKWSTFSIVLPIKNNNN